MIRRLFGVLPLLLLCSLTLLDSGQVWSARPVADTTFPPGAVINLEGTPHLWIADQNGVLHWGGDTRALQGQTIDWNTRIAVSLDTLMTVPLGDPWLSAGLLKDGTPIYLVKWETTDAVPHLLHIQCIHDVEIFGINEKNYGKFVLDRDQWEAQYKIPVSTLQRGELPSAGCPDNGPTVTPTPTQTPGEPYVVPLAPNVLPSLDMTLRAAGLSQASINAARPTTLALPSNIANGVTLAVQAAPLTSAPIQTQANLTQSGVDVPIGVLSLSGAVHLGSETLGQDAYLVRVRSGRVVFTNTQNKDVQSPLPLDARHLNTPLASPATTLTYRDVCFGWAQVQVCTPPAPTGTLDPTQLASLQGSITSARDALTRQGVFKGDVNVSATMSEAAGTSAVNKTNPPASSGNVVAAPALNLPAVTHSGSPPAGTSVGIIAVNTQVTVPSYPNVPPGNYAVQATGDPTRALLLSADGQTKIGVPTKTVQVRGAPGSSGFAPTIAGVRLPIASVRYSPLEVIYAGQAQIDESLAIIANLCFSGDGDEGLCLLFEP
jgi:hypothetical protein